MTPVELAELAALALTAGLLLGLVLAIIRHN